MTDKKKTILEAVDRLTDTYRKEELFLGETEILFQIRKKLLILLKI